MLPQMSFLMRDAFMPINLVYPFKRVFFLYFSIPNNLLLYSLTSNQVLFNSPSENTSKDSTVNKISHTIPPILLKLPWGKSKFRHHIGDNAKTLFSGNPALLYFIFILALAYPLCGILFSDQPYELMSL